jgi:hypothetical protein
MLPLAVLCFVCFSFGMIKTAVFFGVLFVDGVFGMLRVNKHIKLEERFSTNDLKVIQNKIIPFGKYVAMLLFGVMFTKVPITDKIKEHEMTHKVQGYETGYLLMYSIYLLEGLFWTIKLIITFPKWYFDSNVKELKWYQRIKIAITKAYSHICFDQEAHAGDKYFDYKNKRLWYGWLPFLFNDDDSISDVQLSIE